LAKVLGIGGVFFKSVHPEKLGAWYQQWLGFSVQHPYGTSFSPENIPENGYTVWAPFSKDTSYFDPSENPFMFNLIVDDLEGMLSRVEEGDGTIIGEIEEYRYGRFGWFLDPEGNKVELWQPA